MIPDEVKKFLSENGRKGGSAKSDRKKQSARANLDKANIAKKVSKAAKFAEMV